MQKKAQTPNFSEKDAIAKFIESLLPSQLASHLDREPPKSLSELYAEVEKYAKSEADYKRRVEQRKLIRQQLSWQQNNQTNTNQQNQYILPVEPSQDTDQPKEFDPYIIHHPHNPRRNMTTATPKNIIKGAGPTRAEEKEEAEAADLRRARRNCSVTFMGKMLATKLISVPKRKGHLKEWKLKRMPNS